MILGYHFIFSAYGFWLPNDPRGSWSDVIRQYELLAFGPATKISTTRSVAHVSHDASQRLAAKRALKYPPIRFTGEQANAITNGFAEAAAEAHYPIHALAILPDHTHLVVARHNKPIDRIAGHLKGKATINLNKRGLHPLARFATPDGRMPSPWARNYWCPYIHSARQMRVVTRYVKKNPIKAGLRPQRWNLVTPYRG